MKNYYLIISIVALIGLSSCASLRIDKRQHNKGWYVDFGTEKRAEAVAAAEEQKDAQLPQEVDTDLTELSDAPNAYTAEAQQSTVLFTERPAEATTATEPAAPADNPDSAPTTINQNENNSPADNPTEMSPGGDDQILLVILAIFIPPLAVYMVEGTTAVFWITLLCFLFGGVFFFGRFGYGYLGGLGLVAIVLALLVVFGKL